jgi:predicted metalloprotease with PDZ domain
MDTVSSSKSYLGVELREHNGRVTIKAVVENGPAWHAGLNVGDEIVAMDGFRVESSKLAYFKMRKPGDMVEVTINRKGILRDLVVTVGFWPDEISALRKMDALSEGQQSLLEAWLRRP